MDLAGRIELCRTAQGDGRVLQAAGGGLGRTPICGGIRWKLATGFSARFCRRCWRTSIVIVRQMLQMPYLAALVCCSPFDIALHDAYGRLHGVPTYDTYNARIPESRSWPISIRPDDPDAARFRRKVSGRLSREATAAQRCLCGTWLAAWIRSMKASCTGDEPDDGYPVALTDWIERDGLNCLKVKLRGNDAEWDYDRLVRVGRIAMSQKRRVALGRLQLHGEQIRRMSMTS